MCALLFKSPAASLASTTSELYDTARGIVKQLRAEDLRQRHAPKLRFVHPMGLDNAGHVHAGASAAHYLAARVVDAWTIKDSTGWYDLAVTADASATFLRRLARRAEDEDGPALSIRRRRRPGCARRRTRRPADVSAKIRRPVQAVRLPKITAGGRSTASSTTPSARCR